MNVSVQQGNIVEFEGDAIVNAANVVMLGGGGVDGAIHRAAGPELKACCEKFPEKEPGIRCRTGEAEITAGFNLKATAVIHTVGPIFYDSQNSRDVVHHGELVERRRFRDSRNPAPLTPRDLLKQSIRSCLLLADTYHIKTMAMPAISCGVFGGSIPVFAKVLHEVVNENKWEVDTLTIILFQDWEFAQFSQTWDMLEGKGDLEDV